MTKAAKEKQQFISFLVACNVDNDLIKEVFNWKNKAKKPNHSGWDGFACSTEIQGLRELYCFYMESTKRIDMSKRLKKVKQKTSA